MCVYIYMALILAWEQDDTEGSQQPQEEEAADEVDIPAPSPERSQEPTPSTSTAKVAAAPSADILPAVIPKLKRKNAMTRKTINVPRSCADDHRHYACKGHIAPPPKTRHAPKKSSVSIASDSNSEAI